jgi:hypothetical protein
MIIVMWHAVRRSGSVAFESHGSFWLLDWQPRQLHALPLPGLMKSSDVFRIHPNSEAR